MADLLESVVTWEIPMQDEQVDVRGLVQGPVLCVSRGASVHILSESSNSEIEFEETVDAVAWSADYPWLLVIGTRSGRIIFMNSSTSTTLFSQMVDHNCAVDHPVFLSLHFGKGRLLVQTAKSILMLKCDLQSGLQSGCIDDFIKDLQNNVEVSQLNLTSVDNDVISFVRLLSAGTGKCRLLSTGHVEHMLCVWEETDGKFQLKDSVQYWTNSVVVHCDVTMCGKYLVLLTNKGALSIWSASLLIMINVYAHLGERVSDFCIYKRQGCGLSSTENGLASNVDGICFLSEDKNGEITLHLSSLPSLEENYSVKVSHHATLAHGVITEDNLYYLDYNEASSSIQVIQLVQSLPENKVAWLMSQHQFTEALQFAREHGIDLELVYKNKAKLLNQKLSGCATCSPETAELLTSLEECWQNIKDEQFILEIVFHFSYLNLDLTTQVLQSIKLQSTNLSSKVNSALNLLTTYKLILGSQPFSSDSWRSFLKTSTLELIKQYLLAGDLHSVFLLHERHKLSLVEEMDQVAISSLLSCLPVWVESQFLEEWLSLHLLPLLLQHVPQAMDDMLIWTMERIKMLELGERECWPGNALKVCEAVLDSITSFKPSTSLQPHPLNLEVRLEKLSSLKGMTSLRDILKDLVFLQSTIQWLEISLAEYQSEPREVVVYKILDKLVATELVADTLQSKVVPYVHRHNLNLDQVLLGYIKVFLDRLSASWNAGPHEAKVIALIQAIKDVEIHIEACVELLRHMQADWSEDVEELVHTCLGMDHPSCANLKKQYRLLQLKKLLQSYDIRDFNFAGATQGWFYIRRILLSCSEKALHDALEVADMYHVNKAEVYKNYLVGMVKKEQVELAADVLESLPFELKLKTVRATFALASSKLAIPFRPLMDVPSERIADIQLALISLRSIKNCLKQDGECHYWNGDLLGEESFDVTAFLDLYKRLLALQVEYTLYLSPDDIQSETKCKEILDKKVQECVIQNRPCTTAAKIRMLTRFCDLLGAPAKTLWQSIGEACLEYGHLDRIKEFCRTLMDNHIVESAFFHGVVRGIWEHAKNSPESLTQDDVTFVQSLLSYLVSSCAKPDLPEAVDFFHIAIFFSSLFAVCTQMEGLDVANESTTAVKSWSDIDGHYVDDGMVLDQAYLIPVLARYSIAAVSSIAPTLSVSGAIPRETSMEDKLENELSSASNLNEDNKEEVATLSSLASHLSSILEENNHTQLLLHCTISTLSKLNQELVTKCLMESVALPSEMVTGRNICAKLLNNFTEKVISSSTKDHDYSLCLLLAMPPSEAGQLLLAMKAGHGIANYIKAMALCKLSLDYCHIVGSQQTLEAESLAVLKKAEWGQLLSHYKVSYTKAFRGGGMEAKNDVGTALLHTQDIDVATVLQYYREELGQEVEATLLLYLRVVLTEWEEPYAERAEFIMKKITSKRKMLDLFTKLLFTKVHPYDYQKIALLLQFLQQIEENLPNLKTSQGLLILDCLRNYKRISVPSDFEKKWYTDHHLMVPGTALHSSITSLPSLASTCLPFHPLLYSNNPMEIIGPEISKPTVAVLTAVSRILKLPMDDFYATAIKNITLKHEVPQSTDQLQQPEEPLEFEELLPLLRNISDVFSAVTVARWLVENLQGEKEKNRALEAALAMAREAREQAASQSDLEQANIDVGLLETMLTLSQSQCLLRQHNLNLPKYQGIAPHTLIMELFTDVPDFTQGEVPPLHDIAAELAKLHKLSLNKIKNKLSEQWLLSLGHSSSPLDTTMSQVSDLDDSIGSPQDLPSPEDEDSLTMKRLVYLLDDPAKLEENIIMLLNWAKRTSMPVSCLCRVRALQVLLAIASPSTIKTVSGTSLHDIKDFMQSALFVCELESLKISTKLPAFIKCNKAGLVRTLWRNHAQKTKAIRLVSELCLYYGLGDAELWKKTLDQLLRLEMFPYLRSLLQKLANRPEVEISSLTDAWKRCIFQPLESMSPPLSVAQVEECNESLRMAYSSPMPWKVGGAKLVDLYDKLGLRVHALACLALIPLQHDKDDLLQNLLSDVSKEDYQHILGFKLIVGLEQVKEVVFCHIDNQDVHEVLLGSEYFNEFVSFLVSRKSINSLLKKSLQLGRYEEGIKLVEIFNTVHSISTSATGKEALMEYVIQNYDYFQRILPQLQATSSPHT